MAKKKSTITLVEAMKQMYEQCNGKAYPAAQLGINVEELNARIEVEIYPKAKKDLNKGIFSEEALIYIREEGIKFFKICKERGVYATAPYSRYSDFIEPHLKSITAADQKYILATDVKDFAALKQIYPDLNMIVAKAFVFVNKGAVSWYKIFERVREHTLWEKAHPEVAEAINTAINNGRKAGGK